GLRGSSGGTMRLVACDKVDHRYKLFLSLSQTFQSAWYGPVMVVVRVVKKQMAEMELWFVLRCSSENHAGGHDSRHLISCCMHRYLAHRLCCASAARTEPYRESLAWEK